MPLSMEARFRSGRRELIEVREITAREYCAFIELTAYEPELLEMVLRKTPEWVDQLRPDSHTAIVHAVRIVNVAVIYQWIRRVKSGVLTVRQIASDLAETAKQYNGSLLN